MGEQTAKAKEALGWATGDREEEAEGRAEQAGPNPDQEAVDKEEHAVRQDHGDLKT